jgi:hypothetical protein
VCVSFGDEVVQCGIPTETAVYGHVVAGVVLVVRVGLEDGTEITKSFRKQN